MQHITQDTTQHIIHTEHNMHTERTQNAHRMHTHNAQNRIQNTDTTIMQHIEDNREQDTETNTHSTENNAQHQRTGTTQFCTYSFDIYHEYVAIKNSNTIELYTILQDEV